MAACARRVRCGSPIRWSIRRSISSPMRSTRPSATAESYRGPSSAWAATDAVISSRSLAFTRTRYVATGSDSKEKEEHLFSRTIAGYPPPARPLSPAGKDGARTRSEDRLVALYRERPGRAAAAVRRKWQTGRMDSLHSAPRPGARADQGHQGEAGSPAMSGPVTIGPGAGSLVTIGPVTASPVTAGAAAVPGPGEPCVLLKQGEIFLKGRNRLQFERMLYANVRAAVRRTGVRTESVQREGVLVLRVPRDGLTPAEHSAAVDLVAERAADVPGIARVSRALLVDKTPEAAIA